MRGRGGRKREGEKVSLDYGKERRKGRSWGKGISGNERGGARGKELLDYERRRREKGEEAKKVSLGYGKASGGMEEMRK